MKPQDAVFVLTFLILAYMRKPSVFVYAGLFSLMLSIPLFATWTFFTAERLVWYAVAFFSTSIFLSIRPRAVQ